MANGTKPKPGSGRRPRRREELRRNLPRQTLELRSLIQQPEFVNAALITVAFMLVLSVVAIWSREQIKVTNDRVMLETRLKRLDYRVPDMELTEAKREEARKSAPQIYSLNQSYLDRLSAALNGLPMAVAGKNTIEDISPELRQEFKLTEAGLLALSPFAIQGQTTPEWKSWVDNLIRRELPASPLLGSEDYQNHWVLREYAPTKLKRVLQRADGAREEIPTATRGIELLPEMPPEMIPKLEQIVLMSGFPAEVVPYVAAKLANDGQPTLFFDKEATDAVATRDAESVATVYVEHRKGDVIYRRGDLLSLTQLRELENESTQFGELAAFGQIWLPRAATLGLMAIVSMFLVGYVLLFYPRVARNPIRLMAICALLAVMLGITGIVGARSPGLLYIGAVAPTIFVAIVALLAYDQRLALFLSAIQCALATFVLNQGVGMFLLLFAGCGVAVAQLREMRHRSTLIQASAITAAVLAAGGLLLGMLETPPVEGYGRQIILNGFWAGFGGFAVGFVVLGILPAIESWFDITTGMTLAELRDPKQPLLKQLQQKAPGTYNHSLQVANIAEAASEAIGANGLLVYVGALYHDIGKMNKPDYFVENQSGGESKHDKLSPAMSLLVIVGHVKDGIELAREYNLPRQIQHFIESHHGTTLVEYFYHAAKNQSEGGDVAEVEFRYPGPKPRTKEAAILMLADCVESATRSMADPNPARIEQLVRKLSRKRLTDGQYDQSDLTFRELGLIEESMIKSLCAIYHGRISYPGQKEREQKPAAQEAPQPQPASAGTAPGAPRPAPAKQASA